MKHAILSLAAALLSLPAAAQEVAPAAPEKPVCRRIVATGSNVAKKICHTKAEWKALNAGRSADKDALRDRPMNQQPLGNN